MRNFDLKHNAYRASLTAEQRAAADERYEAFKAEAAAIERKIEVIRAKREREGVVAKMETTALTPGVRIPSPESVGLQENMLLWTHLYYDAAIDNALNWRTVGM